jgi:hypothetical protein
LWRWEEEMQGIRKIPRISSHPGVRNIVFLDFPLCPTRAPAIPAHHTWLSEASALSLFPLSKVTSPCAPAFKKWLTSSPVWRKIWPLPNYSSTVWVILSRNFPFLSTLRLRLTPRWGSVFRKCQ